MKHKADDTQHFERCHERWIKLAGHDLQQWREDQCQTCIYYIPLTGLFTSDWGACTNRHSPHDGTVKFEHGGCDQHERADEPQS